jgi:hypothetical protein
MRAASGAILPVLLSVAISQFCVTKAQEAKTQTTCPVITIICPDETYTTELMDCSASVSRVADSSELKFQWTVSNGRLVKGQDTQCAQISTYGSLLSLVELTVEVIGSWPDHCPRQARGEARVYASDPGPELLTEYGDIPFDNEKPNLDQLVGRLILEPGTQPVIIAYAGRRAFAGEALRRAEQAKEYLVSHWKIEPLRIIIVDGGYRDTRSVELWLRPQGADVPVAIPTLDSKQVQIIKEPKKRSNRK